MKFPIIAKHANSVAAITPSSNLVKPRQPPTLCVLASSNRASQWIGPTCPPQGRFSLASVVPGSAYSWSCLGRMGSPPHLHMNRVEHTGKGARQDLLPALPLVVVLVVLGVVLVQVLGVVPPADGLSPAKLRVLPVWVILSNRSACFWRSTTPLGGEANAHTTASTNTTPLESWFSMANGTGVWVYYRAVTKWGLNRVTFEKKIFWTEAEAWKFCKTRLDASQKV